MTDSADIKTAQQRLQAALKTLESSVAPLMSKVSRLEAAAQEAGNFSEDRARLAAELDETKAKLADIEAKSDSRETEFSILADETTQELDRVIRQVRAALGHED